MSEGYTLKELVQEVRNDNKAALATQATILSRLENIDEHLANLNSKVASHEQKINGLTMFETKVMAVWSVIVIVITTFANKVLANF